VLNLTVRSLTSLSASYEVSLNCSEAIKNVSSQTVSIPAKTAVSLSFNIYSESSLRGNHSCVAFLLSSKGKELHKVDIKFSTEATVFESTLRSPVPQLESTGFPLTLRADEEKQEVLCEQLCLNTANIFCKLVNVASPDQGCSLFSRNFITFSVALLVLLFFSCCSCICCCGPKKFFKRLKKVLGCVFKVACCLWLCKKTAKEVDEEMDDEELNLKKSSKKAKLKKAKAEKRAASKKQRKTTDGSNKQHDSAVADMENSSQQLNPQSSLCSSSRSRRIRLSRSSCTEEKVEKRH